MRESAGKCVKMSFMDDWSDSDSTSSVHLTPRPSSGEEDNASEPKKEVVEVVDDESSEDVIETEIEVDKEDRIKRIKLVKDKGGMVLRKNIPWSRTGIV